MRGVSTHRCDLSPTFLAVAERKTVGRGTTIIQGCWPAVDPFGLAVTLSRTIPCTISLRGLLVPTISDVAAAAGVSMTTVSRVLNNKAHVRQALRDRVMDAVESLSYKPDFAARQLAGAKSFVITLLIFEYGASYYANLVVAAAAECRKHGYHLLSETVQTIEPIKDAMERVIAGVRPDGIILPPPLCDNRELISLIAAAGIPLVRLSSLSGGYGSVIHVSEFGVSMEMMRHLVGLGHRRIGFIGPPRGHSAALERANAYEQALKGADLPLDPMLVESGNFSFASGALAARRLLAQPRPPTAIFAANDGMALGVLAIAAEQKLRVPEDLAIAGFDDSPGSRMCYPALTTVRQPLEGLARRAVLTLLGHPDADEPLQHQLLIRGSTTGRDKLVLDTLDA